MTRDNHRHRERFVVPLFITLSVACARVGTPPVSTGIATDGASTLTGLVARDAAPSVDVRNQSGTDLRVYAVMPNGRSVRLGLVPKLGAVTLALPKGIAFPTELTLVAVPLGHDDPQVMEPIKVDGGTRVLLRVAPHGGSSMVTTQP